MILVIGGFGRRIALAFLCHRMDQDRPVIAVAHIAQDSDQLVQIMAVNRTDIAKAHFLEQRAAHRHAAHVFLGLAGRFLDTNGLGDAFAELADIAVAFRRDEARKIMAHRPDGRRDRHVIVIENNDQALAHRPGIIHRLIGHACRH